MAKKKKHAQALAIQDLLNQNPSGDANKHKRVNDLMLALTRQIVELDARLSRLETRLGVDE